MVLSLTTSDIPPKKILPPFTDQSDHPKNILPTLTDRANPPKKILPPLAGKASPLFLKTRTPDKAFNFIEGLAIQNFNNPDLSEHELILRGHHSFFFSAVGP